LDADFQPQTAPLIGTHETRKETIISHFAISSFTQHFHHKSDQSKFCARQYENVKLNEWDGLPPLQSLATANRPPFLYIFYINVLNDFVVRRGDLFGLELIILVA